MQHVYTARDDMDAHFVRGLLERDGIQALVQGEPLGAALGGLPLSGEALPSVWVDDADVVKAAPIVEEYRRVDRANAEDDRADRGRATWKCANCGEAVEEQFTQCWKCGHGPPASAVAPA